MYHHGVPVYVLAVDTIPDMFRTTANVTGWLCVASILSRGAAVPPKPVAYSAVGGNHK